MRTFIAIELSRETKEALAKIQDQLKTAQADVKWVEPKNIHLTLKFLGEVDDKKISKITQSLKEACSQTKPFNIKLVKLGAFPNLRFPRIIWVGTKEGAAELRELTDLIEGSLVKLKFAKEKRTFSAHFTLGRVRSLKFKEALCQRINVTQIPELKEGIRSIVLFKSILSSGGPIYEKLSEENFKTS